MDALMSWVRRIVCYLCAFQLLLHVLPGNSYKKYVNFFGSMILLLLAIQPLSGISGSLKSFEQEIEMFRIRGEAAEMKQSMEGLEELRSDAIDQAFQKELTRQIQETAEACGLTEVKVSAAFHKGMDQTLTVTSVNIQGRGDEAAKERIQEELGAMYEIGKTKILVRLLQED